LRGPRWIWIDASGNPRPAADQSLKDRAYRNAGGERTGARLVYPQSVFVFGHLPRRRGRRPSRSELMYGRAKLEAERLILAACVDALVIRMAGFFGGDARDKNSWALSVAGCCTCSQRGHAGRGRGSVWQPEL
jgi:dTDP-4-dehydrorhamnose reductase